MSKRVLIVGTSHSMGSCEGYRDDTNHLKHDERWHDYFKSELGYEVVNLSMSGCTAQQQLMTVYAYFKDHPDDKFDLAIVEGRGMESVVSEPMHFRGGPPDDVTAHPSEDEYDFKRYYEKWLDSAEDRHMYSPVTSLPPTISYDYQQRYLAWYIEYVFSMNHALDQWSVNLTLCDYLARYCDTVKWFCWSYAQDDVTDLKLALGKDLLSRYALDWPILQELYDINAVPDVECDCGHLNPKGHKLVWKAIKNKLESNNIL